MSVAVRFPDGSVHDLPGQLRRIDNQSFPARCPTFEQVPLNCDARWQFTRHGQDWFAHPRSGHIASLRQTVEEWWRPIAVMADEKDDAACARWESAA